MAITDAGTSDLAALIGSQTLLKYRGRPAWEEAGSPERAPKKAKARSEKACVYVATEQGKEGLTKVGYSEAPEQRVKALASMTGLDLDLTYVSKRMRHAVRIEGIAHRILFPFRKSRSYWIICDTEWFQVSAEMAQKAVIEAIKLARIGSRMHELGISPEKWMRDL